MLCCVNDCGREAMYTEKQLCQKHYFRQWRYGTTDLTRKAAQPRREDERGYQFLHAPDHPLCTKGKIYVAEHRVKLYEALGPGPMNCALCGCGLTWETCDVDHIDENPRNNDLSNLRPTCRTCNTHRSMPPPAEWSWTIALTFEGETKTAQEWARDPRVSLSGGQIRRRKRTGMSDFDALFAPKITHNGKGKEKRA